MNRIAIVFDGEKWHVRRIRVIEHDMGMDEKVYRCDEPISNDHENLSDVPQVQEIVGRALAIRDRKPGGGYVKADKAFTGEAPFLYSLAVQSVPAGAGYPECFAVIDKDRKTVAWLTERQVREALARFDAIAVGEG